MMLALLIDTRIAAAAPVCSNGTAPYCNGAGEGICAFDTCEGSSVPRPPEVPFYCEAVYRYTHIDESQGVRCHPGKETCRDRDPNIPIPECDEFPEPGNSLPVGCDGAPSSGAPHWVPRPSQVDVDEDGLPDVLEQLGGLDLNCDGMMDEHDIAMPKAVVGRRDLYIELDCLQYDGDGNGLADQSGEHSHCPFESAVRDYIEMMADLPLVNFDGTQGIQVHIDTGPIYDRPMKPKVVEVPGTSGASCSSAPCGSYGDYGHGGPFDETGLELIQTEPENAALGPLREDVKAVAYTNHGVWRWGLFAHSFAGEDGTDSGRSGIAGKVGFLVTLADWGIKPNGPTGSTFGSARQQLGTLAHEFGHNLGLGHGGGDGVNNKPNYLSVMNYDWQLRNDIPHVRETFSQLEWQGVSYSPVHLNDLDEESFDECLGYFGRRLELVSGTSSLDFGFVDVNNNRRCDGATCGPGVCGRRPVDTQNLVADLNDDRFCVTPGSDGTLETTKHPDDEYEGDTIIDGDDYRCDTKADSTDDQKRKVGNEQRTILTGWDDLLTIQAINVGVGSTGAQDPTVDVGEDELSYDEAEAARLARAEQVMPVVTSTITGAAQGAPGTQVDLDFMLENTGRGPALDLEAVITTPDDATAHPLGLLKLGFDTTAHA